MAQYQIATVNDNTKPTKKNGMYSVGNCNWKFNLNKKMYPLVNKYNLNKVATRHLSFKRLHYKKYPFSFSAIKWIQALRLTLILLPCWRRKRKSWSWIWGWIVAFLCLFKGRTWRHWWNFLYSWKNILSIYITSIY